MQITGIIFWIFVSASQTSMLGKWKSCIINLQVIKDITRTFKETATVYTQLKEDGNAVILHMWGRC